MHPTYSDMEVLKTSRLDRAMALLVCAVLAIAVLYPQSYFSANFLLGNKWLDPLAMMAPLLALAGAAYLATGRQEIRGGLVDLIVLGFSMFLLVHNSTSPSALVTLKYVTLGLGTFYVTALLVKRAESLSRMIMYTIVGLTLATALYGLVEYAVQENFIFIDLIRENVPDPRSGIHRIGSTLAHPVPFGAFLLQVMPFAGLLLAISRSTWQRVLAFTTMAVGALALVFTYSKGSWLVGVVLAGGTMLVILRTRNKKAVFPALMIAVLVLATAAVFWQRIESEVDERSISSVSGREVAWRAALAGIEEHPLGVGLFQGAPELVTHIDPEWYEAWGQPLAVDNYYLCLLLEAGIIGFVIWIAMVILIVREGIGVARARGPSRPWALVALASILAILLNSFTVDTFLQWPNYLTFWIAAGIIHGISWGKRSSD